jgi:hypothetical protein
MCIAEVVVSCASSPPPSLQISHLLTRNSRSNGLAAGCPLSAAEKQANTRDPACGVKHLNVVCTLTNNCGHMSVASRVWLQLLPQTAEQGQAGVLPYLV